MNKTPIEWTDYSVNPFKMRMPDGTLINACIHKSDGCKNCYAESIVRRWWKKEWGSFPGYTAALLKSGTPVLVEDELTAVLRLSERIAKGKADPDENKIFWNDMTDEFLDFWPDEFIDKCFAVRALTPNLIHQVLTKRPERMRAYVGQPFNELHDRLRPMIYPGTGHRIPQLVWPLPSVHLGVSCEDQKTADERIPLLLQTPAAVRWISAEPLLGPIDLSIGNMIGGAECYCGDFAVGDHGQYGKDRCKVCRCQGVRTPWSRNANRRIDWVVVGGESGNGARKLNIDWARSVVTQCQTANVPVFVKQLGRVPFEPAKFRRDGDAGLNLKDKKGGDMAEWPEDLRVREFPEAKAVTNAA